MTYKEWASRPDLISALAEILNSTPVQLALSVCIEEQLPKTVPSIMASANPIELNALMNAKREGYFEFLRNFKNLAVERPVSLDPDKFQPWKHVSDNQD